ncbi:VacJ family lipoprotein [Sphingomonas aerolata]|uniref:MlaA family lipoprotein n=1 Tax=Sphingomonas aerolata TaxID=185951 RepID=UPI00335C52EF
MLAFSTATMVAALAVQAVDPLPVAPVPVAPSAVVADEQRVPESPVVPVSPPVVPVAPVAAPQTVPVPAPVPAEPTAQKDIVVVGQSRDAGDPLRGVNAQAFGATQAVDSAVVGPVARVYKRKVPSPIRKGIHNFLYNLREPIVFVNFLLQFKPGKAAETVGRFVINSTVGAAGVIDVAKKRPFRLPRRSNGFANTLGYHGIGNGPFLFLPLVGPTTVRDLIGGTLDRLLLPTAIGSPFTDASYTVPAGVLGALDHRADFDETLKCLHDDVGDPYASSRAFYLHRRQAEIDHLHRRPPAPPPECQAALPATRIPVGAAGATETVPPPGP